MQGPVALVDVELEDYAATDRGIVSVSGRIGSRVAPKRQGEHNAQRQAAAGGSFIGARACGLFGATDGRGSGSPVSVTYGPLASTAEGDPDYREIIFLSVPESVGPPVPAGVRSGQRRRPRPALRRGRGDHDPVPALRRRWRLHRSCRSSAGRGTACGRQRDRRAQLRRRSGTGWSLADPHELCSGTRRGGRRSAHLPAPGQGTAGDDANLYEVTLSLREHRNLPPDGLEIFSFAPSLRVPDEDLITEMRFLVPEDAERLTIRNFDAAMPRSRSPPPSARRRSPPRVRTNGARPRWRSRTRSAVGWPR